MIGPQTLLQNRYLVLKQIGQGGMGAVYLATDQRFGSMVALKETFFTDTTLRKAFEREARLLNRLRHAALPNVSDHFVEDEGQFLVMEYIAGEDLSEMLKQQGGAFPVKEVLVWADQLLDALDYLHTQESPVIHRDIKPQNLKLTPRGQIILLDFGLAKGSQQQVSQVTHSGSLFGYSRNYAPIEQIQGTGTDPRSDLYSLASTLYHLLTGVTPPDALTRAAEVLNGKPDPLRPANEVHSQITPAVAQVLMRAMSQNAGQRPQTAAAMREELVEAGKQTLTAGSVTNAHAIAASTILEQDTQLMGTKSVDAQTATDRSINQAESVIAHHDPTSIGAIEATRTGEPPIATALESAESEVTRVSQPEFVNRSYSGRTVGIAIGGLVLVVLAAVAFAMYRKQTTQPAIVPADTSNTSTNNAPAVQPSTNQNSNSSSPVPTESTQPTSQKTENKKPSQPSRTTEDLPTIPTSPVPPGSDPRANSNSTRNTRDANNANMTTEEIIEARRRARLEQKRAAAERQRAERERRRAEEMRRRQLYGTP